MKKIHFYVNEQKPRGKAMRELLTAEAQRHGIGEAAGFDADVVVALGGDGTILRAVHEFPGVPILGLNLGGLGYLSSVGENDFTKAIAMLAEGRYRVSERSMMEIREVKGKGEGEQWKDDNSSVHLSSSPSPCRIRALNDVVIVREMSGHAAILDLAVDGRAATRYLADGLVLATPTGSTAYSLSAGGPVLLPDSCSFVITPMNPHALGIRPMVVNDGSSFTITSRARKNGKAEKIGIYADGEPVAMLEADASIEIGKAAQGARLVELEGYDPYEVLSRKLGWCGTNVR